MNEHIYKLFKSIFNDVQIEGKGNILTAVREIVTGNKRIQTNKSSFYIYQQDTISESFKTRKTFIC